MSVIEFPEFFDVLVRPALGQEDDNLNACFYTEGSFDIYATGYCEAAKRLFESVRETGHGQDTLVYPIVFLWRQYFELALKDLVMIGRYLRDVKNGSLGHHKLNTLWSEFREHVEVLSPNHGCDLDSAASIIEQLHQIDPDSFHFRYPTDKKGTPTVSHRPNMSLENFHNVMQRLANFFECSSCEFQKIRDYKEQDGGGDA